MRVMSSLVMLLIAIGGVKAQSPDPPLKDTRLTVHTLLREDVFAGFMSNDMVRFTRAERNIEQLLKDRPDQRGNLLAWQGGAAIYRSVIAHESGNNGEFLKYLQAARAAFAEAAKQTSGNEAVAAITGGTYVGVRRSPAGTPPRHRMGGRVLELLAHVEAAGIGHRQTPGPSSRRSAGRPRSVGSANRPDRGDGPASRSYAHAAARHAVRSDGTAVEGESGECGHDQGYVQGLPQPGAFIVAARIVAEVIEGDSERLALKLYIDRIATIGCTDAARRAGTRLARTATSTAIAAPTT